MTRASFFDSELAKTLHEGTGCDYAHIERLVKIAVILGDLSTYLKLAEAEESKLFALPRCCGVVYWRDKEQTQLYLNHGTGQDCPYCGRCGGRSRIRRYIKADEHEEAFEARGNWYEWLVASKETTRIRTEYNLIVGRLELVVTKQGKLL